MPGTGFNTVGSISCLLHEAQPMPMCTFGVRRRGGGDAELTIGWPDGGVRILRFAQGVLVSSDSSEPMRATHESDLARIAVGAERFVVPDVVCGD